MKDLGKLISKKVREKMSKDGIKGLEFAKEIMEPFDIAHQTAKIYVSNARRGAKQLQIIGLLEREIKVELDRLSYFLNLLGFDENEETIKALKSRYVGFDYPPKAIRGKRKLSHSIYTRRFG